MKLTDLQWKRIAPLFNPACSPIKPGRPPTPARKVLDGVLWVLKTGARWKDLPAQYPPYQTCHRRFQQWARDGTMEKALHALARDLHQRGHIDIREAFIDGTFSSAKKGVWALGRPNAAKALRSWQSQILMVFLSPYALRVLRRMK
jgi:transposase